MDFEDLIKRASIDDGKNKLPDESREDVKRFVLDFNDEITLREELRNKNKQKQVSIFRRFGNYVVDAGKFKLPAPSYAKIGLSFAVIIISALFIFSLYDIDAPDSILSSAKDSLLLNEKPEIDIIKKTEKSDEERSEKAELIERKRISYPEIPVLIASRSADNSQNSNAVDRIKNAVAAGLTENKINFEVKDFSIESSKISTTRYAEKFQIQIVYSIIQKPSGMFVKTSVFYEFKGNDKTISFEESPTKNLFEKINTEVVKQLLELN